MVKTGGADPGAALTFAADLTSDAGWADAVAGCDYVLHVDSPFPPETPKHEDELIVPARDGALRVLRSARDAGVKRVVLTSSFAAIGPGSKPTDAPFTEEDWADPDGTEVTPYVKSKILAERAAWDFTAREGGALELAVINPVGLFGPVVGPDYSGSIQLVKQLLDGGMPGLPRLSFGVGDVRDLADLRMRHDRSRRQGRAGPRQRRRQHDHAGHRARAEVPAGRRGRPRPRQGSAQLGGAARLAGPARAQAGGPAARQGQELHQ
jgi:nucleoside-diphosphate-sugar epimerase